jgi:Nucleotidyl transferase AbiEii toxin, Type IV TA system
VRDEILAPAQRDVLRALAPTARGLDLYLGGGTAVALHLGHRRSIDFDWFTEGSTLDVERTIERLTALGDFTLDQREQGTVIGSIRGVRVACFEYRYPLLEPLVVETSWDLRLASLLDLSAMKLLAIAQRGSRKDFVDVHVLLDAGLPLPAMLDAFQRKFGAASRMSVLRGLVYFDDAEREPLPDMLVPLDWRALTDRLRRLVDLVISSPGPDRS